MPSNSSKDKAPRQSAKATVTADNRGDLTARRKAEQEQALREQEELAAQEQANEIAAAKQDESQTIDNYTPEPVSPEEAQVHGVTKERALDPTRPVEELQLLGEEDQAQQQEPLTPTPQFEVIRPREDCQFTYGAGNNYAFSAGRAAKVPFEVAQHMREKGLIWD